VVGAHPEGRLDEREVRVVRDHRLGEGSAIFRTTLSTVPSRR
jgi:hypothetical protein